MNPAIAEAAMIVLAAVILAISAVKVLRGWFGPPVSSRTSRMHFWVGAISLAAFWAILIALLYSAKDGQVERNLLMGATLLAVNAVGFAGGWRSTTQPATHDFAAARIAKPGSYRGSITFLGLALVLWILGSAAVLRLI